MMGSILQKWKTEAPRGEDVCPVSHSQAGAWLGRTQVAWLQSPPSQRHIYTWHLCGSPGVGPTLKVLAPLWASVYIQSVKWDSRC